MQRSIRSWSFLSSSSGGYLLLSTQVGEVEAVARVVLGRRADRQESTCIPYRRSNLPRTWRRYGDPFDPGLRVLEEAAVRPERGFHRRPLVAEDAFHVRLVRLGHAPRLLHQGREAVASWPSTRSDSLVSPPARSRSCPPPFPRTSPTGRCSARHFQFTTRASAGGREPAAGRAQVPAHWNTMVVCSIQVGVVATLSAQFRVDILYL